VLRERQSAAGVTVPYKFIWHTASKLARIESLEPHFSNGQLQFLETWNQEYPELIEQLIHFPLAAHDDGSGALAGALMRTPVHGRARRRDRADHGVHRDDRAQEGALSTRTVGTVRTCSEVERASAIPPR
jgi:hypothetical protein